MLFGDGVGAQESASQAHLPANGLRGISSGGIENLDALGFSGMRRRAGGGSGFLELQLAGSQPCVGTRIWVRLRRVLVVGRNHLQAAAFHLACRSCAALGWPHVCRRRENRRRVVGNGGRRLCDDIRRRMADEALSASTSGAGRPAWLSWIA